MSITQYKRREAEPTGPKTIIVDAGVLTEAGMLGVVVPWVLVSSHFPSLRMRVLVWCILKQNRISFKDGPTPKDQCG